MRSERVKVGVEPFIVASTSYKRVTPHANVGYEVNGSSAMSGNILQGTKRRLPSRAPYAAGADVRVFKCATAAFDIVGFDAIHGDRYNPNIVSSFYRQSYNVTNGSTGIELNPKGNLLLVANLLFN